MRTLILVLLWLGVAGFGLMTLCSGVFVTEVPAIALPFGLVEAALAWACWSKIRSMGRQAPADVDHTPPQP